MTPRRNRDDYSQAKRWLVNSTAMDGASAATSRLELVEVADVNTKARKPDTWIGTFFFFVKMPGTAEMEIYTLAQMRRLVKGVQI